MKTVLDGVRLLGQKSTLFSQGQVKILQKRLIRLKKERETFGTHDFIHIYMGIDPTCALIISA